MCLLIFLSCYLFVNLFLEVLFFIISGMYCLFFFAPCWCSFSSDKPNNTRNATTGPVRTWWGNTASRMVWPPIYSLPHWGEPPHPGEGRLTASGGSTVWTNTLWFSGLCQIKKKKKNNGYVNKHIFFWSLDNKTKKRARSSRANVNRIYVLPELRRLRCSWRHSAASVLYTVSAGRRYWKLYCYTTKKQNTGEDQLGQRVTFSTW